MRKIDILKEVYTERQRRWACSQIDAPKSERVLSKSEATEMCKDVKLSKSKDKKPKMKKRDLVEYVIHKNSINEDVKNLAQNIKRSELNEVFSWLNNLRGSGLINMFGSYPLLNWTREDLERWLYGEKNDLESIESEIEDLEYEEDDDYEGEIESLKRKKEYIEYLLDNKDEVRNILIRIALRRIESTSNDFELSRVQRTFEKVAKELFLMWSSNY
jgi:hypothetical protein